MLKFYLSINYVDFKNWEEEEGEEMSVNYRVEHIPRSTPYNRRPGTRMDASTITIHNTGNASSTASNERAWLTNSLNTNTASFHIVIDDKEAIEVIPLDEVAWHAGDGSRSSSGNRTSIGIEICESGNYGRTLQNAAQLVAEMLLERNWGTDRLRRHYDWSGKNCPRIMNTDGKWTGWKNFVDSVSAKLQQLKENNDGEAGNDDVRSGGQNPDNENGGVTMSVEDANKIIRFLSAAYMASPNREARQEFNRLANELRKASGQEPVTD